MSCTRVTRPLQNHARSQWIPSLCGFQSWQLCSALSGQVKYCARGDSCKVVLSVYSPEKHRKKVSECESFQGGLAPLLSVDNVRRQEMGGEGAGGQTGRDPPLLRMEVPRDLCCVHRHVYWTYVVLSSKEPGTLWQSFVQLIPSQNVTETIRIVSDRS